MSQTTDSQSVANHVLFGQLKSELEKRCVRTQTGYGKALNCLHDFIEAYRPDSPIATGKFLGQWFAYMYFRGLSSTTAIHYLDIISALHVGIESTKDSVSEFRTFKKRFMSLLPDIWLQRVTDADFANFLRLVKPGSTDNILCRLLLFSAINGAIPPSEVALIRKNIIEDYSGTSCEILEAYVSTTRKYVFPLRQTDYTPRQFAIHLYSEIDNLLQNHFVKKFGSIDATLRAYWAYAAVKSGISFDVINSIAGPLPGSLPILSLLPQKVLTRAERDTVLKTLEPVFISNPLRWFAMRLRRGVSYEQLIAALPKNTLKPRSSSLYYPYQEITTRIGKKLLFERKPVIRDIVFFRCRITDIPALFHKIGDVAWCYRSGGSYSIISDRDMRLFQSQIGEFTPDYEVAPAGGLRLDPTEKVVIIGGPMKGYQATVVEAVPHKSGAIYRLRILGDANDIEFRIKDTNIIRKIETHKTI